MQSTVISPAQAQAAEPVDLESVPLDAAPSRGPVSARARALARLAADAGQGTVEYVGLLLLMASVLAAIVAASAGLGGNKKIGEQVVTQIGKQIETAGSAKPEGK